VLFAYDGSGFAKSAGAVASHSKQPVLIAH
jgi:hypothetical protein